MINVFIRLTFKAKPARNGTDIHFRVLRRKILAYILSRAIGLSFLPSGAHARSYKSNLRVITLKAV